MSFTRFHNDPCRIKKQLLELKQQENYMPNVPGNGTHPCFMEDPYIRLQKWGANLHNNTINLENSLLGLDSKLSKDCIENVKKMPNSNLIIYPSCQPITEQPRATHPAWTALDIEQNNFQSLYLDPQENTCIPFQNNLNTRLIERDNFKAKPPCVPNYDNNPINTDMYVGLAKKPQLCAKAGNCGSI